MPSGVPWAVFLGTPCSSPHSSLHLFVGSLAVPCGSGTRATDFPVVLLKWPPSLFAKNVSTVAEVQNVCIENVEGWCKPENRNSQSTSSGARGFDEIGTTVIKKELVQALEYRGNMKRFKLGYCFLFFFFIFFKFSIWRLLWISTSTISLPLLSLPRYVVSNSSPSYTSVELSLLLLLFELLLVKYIGPEKGITSCLKH